MNTKYPDFKESEASRLARAREFYLYHLQLLCAQAKEDGVILRINLVPTQPLRMGGVEMVVEVRDARVQS